MLCQGGGSSALGVRLLYLSSQRVPLKNKVDEMAHRELIGRTSGVVVTPRLVPARRDPGTAAEGVVEWQVFDAFAGARVLTLPADYGSGRLNGDFARLLDMLLTMLVGGALEFRAIGFDGVVEHFILLRVTADSPEIAADQAAHAARAAQTLIGNVVPGLTVEPVLAADELASLLQPFGSPRGGDIVRSRICPGESGPLEKPGVPTLLIFGARADHVVVRMLASQPNGAVLSQSASLVALEPDEIETMEGLLGNDLLTWARDHGKIARLDQARRVRTALSARLSDTSRAALLRVSLATPREPALDLVTALPVALASVAGELSYLPATEPGERGALERNFARLGFEAWGPGVGADRAASLPRLSRMASFSEVCAALRLPLLPNDAPTTLRCTRLASRPVASKVPRDGHVIGHNHSAVVPRPVALGAVRRAEHTSILGSSGTGKSQFMENDALAMAEAGSGLAFIDVHGETADRLVALMPRCRVDDVILLDAGDEEFPFPLNALDAHTERERDILVQGLIGMLYHMYDPHHQGIIGPRYEEMVRNAVCVVMADPSMGSMVHIPSLLYNPDKLKSALDYVSETSVREYFSNWLRSGSSEKSEVASWFASKFSAFVSDRLMRNIVGQRTSTFSFDQVLGEAKILIVKLPKGLIGEINMSWLGMIVIAQLQLAAFRRARQPVDERKVFHLYIDEFQNFHTASFETMLSEARKYGVACTLAHQNLDQLSPSMRSSLLTNAANLFVFRTGLPDAHILERELGDAFTAEDLVALDNYRCVCRLTVDGVPQSPFDVMTEPPRDIGDALPGRDIVQLARSRYARPRGEVEAPAAGRTRPPTLAEASEERTKLMRMLLTQLGARQRCLLADLAHSYDHDTVVNASACHD